MDTGRSETGAVSAMVDMKRDVAGIFKHEADAVGVLSATQQSGCGGCFKRDAADMKRMRRRFKRNATDMKRMRRAF